MYVHVEVIESPKFPFMLVVFFLSNVLHVFVHMYKLKLKLVKPFGQVF